MHVGEQCVVENNNIHGKLNTKLDKPNLFLDS